MWSSIYDNAISTLHNKPKHTRVSPPNRHMDKICEKLTSSGRTVETGPINSNIGQHQQRDDRTPNLQRTQIKLRTKTNWNIRHFTWYVPFLSREEILDVDALALILIYLQDGWIFLLATLFAWTLVVVFGRQTGACVFNPADEGLTSSRGRSVGWSHVCSTHTHTWA